MGAAGVRMARAGRVAFALASVAALSFVTGLWMLFAVSVSPFASVLGTLGIDALDYNDAFCIRDAGHWIQLAPAAGGLVAAVAAGRSFWRLALADRGSRAGLWTLAFVSMLAVWVLVYAYVGDCGFGEDDG